MKNKRKLKILCLDVEGGYGGSSRSLFNSLVSLDKSNVDVEVWCKKSGPIQGYYDLAGIPVKVFKNIPKVSSLPRISRNLLFLSLFCFYDWPRSKKLRKKLLIDSARFDLIHCNHESLYWLARWINKNLLIPVTMHKRTNLWPSVFASFQIKVISDYVSGIIFITENERINFIKLGGNKKYRNVIYNIVQKVNKLPSPLKEIPNDSRLKICTLANYSYLRGTDRLIDIALSLKSIGYKEILFVVAGDISLSKSLPGQLGHIAKNGGDLSDYATKTGVGNMFLFLGHVTKPEEVLSACDILIRPSREYNPWGRDVLEALSFGLPVISIGTYDRFVENRVTGFLFGEFDPKKIANCIVKLLQNKELIKEMGWRGKRRVQELCNGPDRAKNLLHFWQKIVEQ